MVPGRFATFEVRSCGAGSPCRPIPHRFCNMTQPCAFAAVLPALATDLCDKDAVRDVFGPFGQRNRWTLPGQTLTMAGSSFDSTRTTALWIGP